MVISIVNHKGGTGKTTTTINLGSALSLLGHKVLLVDFDAQGSLSYSLGIDEHAPTISEVFYGERSIEQVLIEREGMHVLPANSILADVEFSMTKSEDRFGHLKSILSQLSDYDFVLIDCPPSLSLLTLNALVASDGVIIPMQMDVLAMRGLDSMLETIRNVHHLNADLHIIGVLSLMGDQRKNMYQEVLNHIKTNYSIKVFKQSIRANVKTAEAPSFGMSVLRYAPSSGTALDYKQFAKELLKNIAIL